MARKKKEFRELKVSSFSNYGEKMAPMLRLQGLWLEDFGFKVGEPVLVKCEDGKLIISLDENRVMAKSKKKQELEEKIKDLEARYEVEKRKISQKIEALEG